MFSTANSAVYEQNIAQQDCWFASKMVSKATSIHHLEAHRLRKTHVIAGLSLPHPSTHAESNLDSLKQLARKTDICSDTQEPHRQKRSDRSSCSAGQSTDLQARQVRFPKRVSSG